jgi:epoxyqueuosine reductase
MSIDTDTLYKLALDTGLDLVAAVPAQPTPSWDVYREWLEAGYAAEMGYLARPDAVHRRQDPRHILPEAQTVLVVAATYGGVPSPPLPHLHGRVSRYAWGEDYHRWLLKRLKGLVEAIDERTPEALVSRSYVDTGAILERAWAQTGGLGWTGKNTNLIHPRLGSFLFLGVALLSVELPPTPRSDLPSCGTCTRCMEACPTGAIVGPGVLDARRCLSYLTIENRGPIPERFRAPMGPRLFGCDTCQTVCPWNRWALEAHEGDEVPENATLYLPDLLTMDADAFRSRFRTTPIWRATPEGLARSAAVVLGNRGDPAARPYLAEAAAHHPSALVREHAAWALDRLG